MIKAKVLYNNVLRGMTPTWSGTTVSTSPPANATDWNDWAYFDADTGNLDFTVGADTDIDSVAFYVATFTGTGAETIELQYESSPSVFTSLATLNPAGGKLTLTEFSSVTVLSGRRIRFVITVGTGSLRIRQLVVGEVLEAEQGQWATATSPDFVQGVKVSNSISQNGSMIGRSIKRLERSGKIMWEFLSASWCRNTLDPFVRHASRYPFIYVWNPRDYPSEVAFASSEKINPTRHTANGLLSFEMPIKFLVADEEAV